MIPHARRPHGTVSTGSRSGSRDASTHPCTHMDLTELVRTNLVHYNLWLEVEELVVGVGRVRVLRGRPPRDDSSQAHLEAVEFVLPLLDTQSLTVDEIEGVFAGTAAANNGARPAKVIGGIATLDSSVMYYFIWDGLVKPRKN